MAGGAGDGDDGMESFSIDDYDLQSALNPGSRRRGLSKNQQIYGVWADKEDSDDDDTGPSSSFGKKRSSNYKTPVQFVSGGVKKGEKIVNKDDDDNVQQQPKYNVNDDEKPIEIITRFDRNKKKDKLRGKEEFAGMRGPNINFSSNDQQQFGSWQKHTKSDVLMKMMKSMGYVHGQGLGARGQGIVEPVLAYKREGRGAVGAYGKESIGPKFGESAADAQKREMDIDGEAMDDDGGQQQQQSRKGFWKKNSHQQAPKNRYRTVDDILADGGTLKKRLGEVVGSNNSKVIDMTGREQKVYSGYDSFATKVKDPDAVSSDLRTFDIPELAYNLNMLVEMTEEEIDQSFAIKHDRDELIASCVNEEKEHERMRQVLQLIEEFSQKSPTLDECQRLFETLQTDYYAEYKLFGLNSIATANVLPLIKAHFASWNPLDSDQVDYGIDLIRRWRTVFANDNQHQMLANEGKNSDNLPPYDRILWDGWMPSIRRAALNWSPRDRSESMLAVVDTWFDVLPKWIIENLLEQIILPRIHDTVDNWNPLTDTVPIHAWLHPWLTVMGDRLLPVYAPIRQKLARALQRWQPTDASAKQILRPWKDVFAAGTFQSFLAQNILPKLEQALVHMTIDPSRQDYTAWRCAIDWLDMTSPSMIAVMLVRSFFPKWYDTLCMWLDLPTAKLNEVIQWYEHWKKLIPRPLMELQPIRDQLTRALMAIDRSSKGYKVVMPTDIVAPPPPPTHPSTSGMKLPGFLVNAAHQAGMQQRTASFKELVEQRAAERGVAFIPQANKFREGKPVFWFGNISVYIDRNVVFALDLATNIWSPIGIDHLMAICE